MGEMYNSIMQGLQEAVEDVKGKNNLQKNIVVVKHSSECHEETLMKAAEESEVI